VAEPTLSPLSTGELLDRTFSLYRNHFVLFVGLVAITHLPVLAVQLIQLALGQNPNAPFDLLSTLAWFLVILLVTLAVTAASQGATVIAVSHVYLGRSITVTGALAAIRGRIVSLAVTMIVIGLVAGLGFLALIVPGVILSLMWALAIPAAVLEERTLFDAAARSARLTKGDRFRVFVVYMLFVMLMIVVTMVINVPLGVIGFFLSTSGGLAAPPTWLQVTSSMVGYFTQCLVGPLMTIALALLYYDERVRKEAFDLELMMAAIDRQHEVEPITAAGE